MSPGRELLWNQGGHTLLGLLGGLVLLSWGVKLGLWLKTGLPEGDRRRLRFPWEVLTLNGLHLGHLPRRMHRLLLWGFLGLLLATLLVALQDHLGLPVLQGAAYLPFEVLTEFAGLLLLGGLGLAFHLRYLKRAERLQSRPEDALLLALLGLCALEGFLLRGLRLAATHPAWAPWTPLSWGIGRLLSLGGGEGTLTRFHRSLWNFHALTAMGTLALAPWTKLSHAAALPWKRALLRPMAERERIREPRPLESWLEPEACMRCGRCRKPCPIQTREGPFPPETLLGRLKRRHRFIIPAEALWACTGCRACENHCPMGGEHLERILGLRRQAWAAGRVPERVFALAGAQSQHPLPTESLSLEPDTLYLWPGCQTPDPVLQALRQLLEQAGKRLRVLDPPRCCGGRDRFLGHEEAFRQAMALNRAYLEPLRGATLITPCPHCLRTLSHDYGEDWTLLHHTELLARLLEEGSLPQLKAPTLRVTFHDPCFLSRCKGDYQPPRHLLCGTELLEMKQSRAKSVCCGSGGGTVPPGAAARKRLHHALESGAELLVTACPFCREALRSATEAPGKGLPVWDIAELLAQSSLQPR
nr:(Fe-S)-binding protein [uncultured Holophaga sp.]